MRPDIVSARLFSQPAHKAEPPPGRGAEIAVPLRRQRIEGLAGMPERPGCRYASRIVALTVILRTPSKNAGQPTVAWRLATVGLRFDTISEGREMDDIRHACDGPRRRVGAHRTAYRAAWRGKRLRPGVRRPRPRTSKYRYQDPASIRLPCRPCGRSGAKRFPGPNPTPPAPGAEATPNALHGA